MRKKNLKAIAIGAITLLAVTGCSKGMTTTETTAAASAYSGTVEDATKNYMSDTSYKGDTALDIELFQYPFQTSDDNYVSNKDLIAQLKIEDQNTAAKTTEDADTTESATTAATESKKSMEELQESGMTVTGMQKLKNIEELAKDYVETLFGTGYRAIEDNRDGFIDQIAYRMIDNVYIDDYENYYQTKDLVGTIADWMVENHVQADVTFDTDDSLVCMNDDAYTVRGTLTIDAHNCDTDEMAEAIPKGLDYKNGGKYVFDVIIQNYANTGFCITGYYVQGV